MVLATGSALCLWLGFERLVTLVIILYGPSLMLEFVTLVVLRIREPELKREFRVPGGLAGAILAGVFPLLLLGLAVVHGGSEMVLGMNGLVFGLVIIVAGFVVYLGTARLGRRALRPTSVERVQGGYEKAEFGRAS